MNSPISWSDGEYEYTDGEYEYTYVDDDSPIVDYSQHKKINKLAEKVREFGENYGASTRAADISHQLKLPTFCCLNLGGGRSSRRYRDDDSPDLSDRVGYAIVGTIIGAAAAYFVGKELVTYNQATEICKRADKIKSNVKKGTEEYSAVKKTRSIFNEFKRQSMISLALKVTFAAGGAILAVGAVINAVPLMAIGGVALVIGGIGTIGHYGYRSFSDPALIAKLENNHKKLQNISNSDWRGLD